jgi:hypothetical protein
LGELEINLAALTRMAKRRLDDERVVLRIQAMRIAIVLAATLITSASAMADAVSVTSPITREPMRTAQ